jgi:hypothetical protein
VDRVRTYTGVDYSHIDESLDFYGIKSGDDARELERRARAHSKLTEDQASKVAEAEVRAHRRKS